MEKLKSSGWLDPAGKFWDVSTDGHHEFASNWLADENDFDPVGTLLERGWIKITEDHIHYRSSLTQAQLDALESAKRSGK